MPTPLPYCDLQVNGYAGADFNRPDLTPDDFHRACLALQNDGATAFLPTVITDSINHMTACLANLANLREQNPLAQQLIPGFHIEGPFLNETPGYIGAHPTQHAKPANLDDTKRLLDAAAGLTRIVTLAPECDPNFAVTRFLTGQDITVAAGHCDPSLDQLRGAIDAGLTLFTHLGNGCPLQLHRHDNIIQRVLSLADHPTPLFVTFIADGVHVPFPALANYLNRIGPERAIIISDAITAASLGPGQHTLGQQTVHVTNDLATWAPDHSHLIGSACPLSRMTHNLATQLKLTPDHLRKITLENPTRLLQIDSP